MLKFKDKAILTFYVESFSLSRPTSTHHNRDDTKRFGFNQVTDNLVIKVLYWLPLKSYGKICYIDVPSGRY